MGLFGRRSRNNGRRINRATTGAAGPALAARHGAGDRQTTGLLFNVRTDLEHKNSARANKWGSSEQVGLERTSGARTSAKGQKTEHYNGAANGWGSNLGTVRAMTMHLKTPLRLTRTVRRTR